MCFSRLQGAADREQEERTLESFKAGSLDDWTRDEGTGATL